MSPFEDLYGYQVHVPSIAFNEDKLVNPMAKEELERMRQLLQLCKDNMKKAQDVMKANADVHRRHVEFQEGDYVLLKLPKSRHNTLKGSSNSKLAHRYYGPYLIVKRVGDLAYKLDLPSSTRIHNVFHVSNLKRFIGSLPQEMEELPPMNEEGEIIYEPERIIGKRTRELRNRNIDEYLVKWKLLPIDEATWQSLDYVQQHGLLVDESS